MIRTVEANEGDDLLGIAHEYDIDLEGPHPSPPRLRSALTPRPHTGACEGSVACSTCHVILDPESYDKVPEPEVRCRPSSYILAATSDNVCTQDDENDMLDMAFGLTDTSRLGCQVRLTKELDGLTATLPAATRNMFVDGATP